MTDSRVREALHKLADAGTIAATTVCPVCDGGSRKRRTFSVNFDGALALYCCHRASCNVRGALALVSGGRSPVRTRDAFVPRALMSSYRLPHGLDAWGVDLARRGVRGLSDWSMRHGFRVLDRDPSTAVWVVRDVVGLDSGHVTRTRDKRVETWKTTPGPFYGCYSMRELATRPVWIVEDPLSAALLERPAIALYGTNLSREMVAEWRGAGLRNFIVALDADAYTGAGRKACERLRAAGCNAAHAYLGRGDIKDMTPERRAEVVEYAERAFDL